jgi:hypothetical protein
MSLEKLVSEYGVFQQRTGELVKELRVNFPPLFTKLFEKHPWVESFSWRQCEPWNDGEETEFEVMGDSEQITINDLNWYDDEIYNDEAKKDVFKEFAAALEEVPIEIMKALFGESNEVELKRGGEMLVSKYEDG